VAFQLVVDLVVAFQLAVVLAHYTESGPLQRASPPGL